MPRVPLHGLIRSFAVKNLIKSNKVMVFSKSYCPYCTRAKSALSQMGIDFKTLELDEINGGGEIQSYLRQITGQSTVPNIFVRGGSASQLSSSRQTSGTF